MKKKLSFSTNDDNNDALMLMICRTLNVYKLNIRVTITTTTMEKKYNKINIICFCLPMSYIQ